MAVIKHVIKIKGNRRWKHMNFQSRTSFWVESSLVPQNAAPMQPATTPAASKAMSPSLPETKQRKQMERHRDPGFSSRLFAV